MAKTNISFNNQDYQIDPASLSEATAELRQHLSSVMNGTGATINFGGTAYGIDSTKLATVTSAFISHLGAIAGNGYKVVINGVEYNVDSTKIAGAVSELETTLSGLHSDDGGVQLPEKNEYGFYYNVPYVFTLDGTIVAAMVFYDGGQYVSFTKNMVESYPSILFSNWNDSIFLCDGSTLTIGYENEFTYVISEDGSSLVNNDYGVVYSIYGTEHGVYFGSTYSNQNGDTIIFDENNITFRMSTGESRSISDLNWSMSGHDCYYQDGSCLVSLDGSIVYVEDYINNTSLLYMCDKAPSGVILTAWRQSGDYRANLEDYMKFTIDVYGNTTYTGNADSKDGIKSVTVNGVEATIDAYGNWSAVLNHGYTDGEIIEITVVATDNANNTATTTGFVTVQVPPS